MKAPCVNCGRPHQLIVRSVDGDDPLADVPLCVNCHRVGMAEHRSEYFGPVTRAVVAHRKDGGQE